MNGCIIESMAILQTGCLISAGCIISVGAEVNHANMCCDGVHVDCDARIEGYCLVPSGTKICSGEVCWRKDTIKVEDLFFDTQEWEEWP